MCATRNADFLRLQLGPGVAGLRAQVGPEAVARIAHGRGLVRAHERFRLCLAAVLRSSRSWIFGRTCSGSSNAASFPSRRSKGVPKAF